MKKLLFYFILQFAVFLGLRSQQSQEAAPVRLKGGDVRMPEISSLPAPAGDMRRTLLLQFSAIPAEETRRQMAEKGIKLHDFVPEMTFYASQTKAVAKAELSAWGVTHGSHLEAAWKTDSSFWSDGGPEWCRVPLQDGWVQVTAFLTNESFAGDVAARLSALGFRQLSTAEGFGRLTVALPLSNLKNLLNIEDIYWVEPISPPVEGFNLPGRINHRAAPLNVPGPGGRNLWGEGVVIGEWDGAGIGSHADYNDRIINKNPFVAGGNGNHATHVCGTIAGGGVFDPYAQGMAPKARVFGWDFFGNIPREMDTACRRDSIVMTNNSYGYGSDPCLTRGTYDGISRDLDVLVNWYPYLSHQFSSGNSRSSMCAAGGYRTINSGFQAAKNNITVGALQWNDGNSTFHSYGPMRDGRMKPEICGVGVNVYSTLPANTYGGGWNGTSMSCPGVTGTMALLYERFKQLNSGAKPLNHTLKANVLNTADDIGNTGPDYAFGFGRINAVSALNALESKAYKVDSVANGGLWTDTVYIKPGTARFQVMLVWDDLPAAASASPSLVNDLDLEVTDSLGNVFQPWTLNPACHTCLPIRRRDSLNNAEQFFFNNPASGKWVIRVRGRLVTTGREVFTVSSLQWNNFVRVSYPNGHENMLPPTGVNAQTITWDAFGTSSTFTLEYSADSGQTWNNIASGISNATRFHTWNNAPANLSTKKALIRISNGTLTDKSDTTFHIYQRANPPNGITCSRQVHLFWQRTPGAARYRVLQSINSFMEPIGTTTDTFFTVYNLNNGQTYWFSLQAIGPNGEEGPRCSGRSFTPASAPQPPMVTTDPASQVICAGNTLTLRSAATGTPAFSRQWQYSQDGGLTWSDLPGETRDTLNVSLFPWANKGFQYRNRYINICRNEVFTRPAVIDVDTPIRFQTTLGDFHRCEGDSVRLEVTFTAAKTPALQWQRSINNGNSWTDLSGDTTNLLILRNLMYPSNGYSYRLLASNFCESRKPSDTAVIRMKAPLRLLMPADTTICLGNSVNLTARGTGGDSTLYIFNWSGFSTGSGIAVSPTSRTVYRVSLDDQCSYNDVVDSVVVDVRRALALRVSNDTTICTGRSTNLWAVLDGGNSTGYQYRWMPGNMSGSGMNVTPGSTTSYTITALDGCTPDTLTATITVTVRQPLNLQLNNDTLICNGNTVAINAFASGGLTSGYNISWNQGLGTGSSKSVSPATNTTYTAVLSDGCTVLNDTASITVDVRAPLALAINNDTTLCQGRSVTLNATANGGLSSGYQVQWNQGLGSGFNHAVSPSSTTTYRAILTDGCTVRPDTQHVTITMLLPLSVNAGRDTTLCDGRGVSLMAATSGGTGTYSWRWERVLNPTPALATGASLNHTPTASGRIRVIVSDGCTVRDDSSEVNLTLLPALSLQLSPDTSICQGNQALLRSRTTGGTGTYIYNWTDLQTGTTAGSSNNLTVTPASSRNYSITVTDGCSVGVPSGQIQVTVVPMPVAAFSIPNRVACDPGIFTIDNNSSGTRFTLNGRPYSGSDTTIRLNTGTHNVLLTAFNSLGCTQQTSETITVNPTPVAGFTFSPANPRQEDAVVFTDQSSGASVWFWSLPNGVHNTQTVPNWKTNDTGTWNLIQIVGNNNGCYDTISRLIRVGVGYFLHVPTGFTPNEDGLNDVWKPELRGAQAYELRIFNRWGQQVFRTDKPDQGWNGNGAPAGSYAFMLSLTNAYGEKVTEKGTFTLLR